jgi:hypothetical protein
MVYCKITYSVNWGEDLGKERHWFNGQRHPSVAATFPAPSLHSQSIPVTKWKVICQTFQFQPFKLITRRKNKKMTHTLKSLWQSNTTVFYIVGCCDSKTLTCLKFCIALSIRMAVFRNTAPCSVTDTDRCLNPSGLYNKPVYILLLAVTIVVHSIHVHSMHHEQE